MTAIGTWALTMSTPMGEQKGQLVVASETQAHMVNGEGEIDELMDFAIVANKLSWKVHIKKPMPMKLVFEVLLDGDTLDGKFRPGMFPPGPVKGVRA